MSTYQPTHYDIWVKPIFVKADGEYPFDGMLIYENAGYEIATFEFRFIIDTLRHYFGDNLDFDVVKNQIKILTLSNAQMKILRGILEDSCDCLLKYGRSHLKFEIGGYYYDKPKAVF